MKFDLKETHVSCTSVREKNVIRFTSHYHIDIVKCFIADLMIVCILFANLTDYCVFTVLFSLL